MRLKCEAIFARTLRPTISHGAEDFGGLEDAQSKGANNYTWQSPNINPNVNGINLRRKRKTLTFNAIDVGGNANIPISKI